MQWVIDLMTEWAEAQGFLTTSYVDRGIGNVDWNAPFFTRDGAWHDFDISAEVPEGAKAAHFHIRLTASALPGFMKLKKKGQAGAETFCTMRCQVTGVHIAGHFIVAVDDTRILEYLVSNTIGGLQLFVSVKGYWY